MLGKLSRWLLILGQDIQYSNKLDDDKLILIAEREKRIILTKDMELYHRAVARGIDAFYIRGSTESAKLAELARQFNFSLDIDLKRTRCPKCNTRISPIRKEEIANKIKKKTYTYYNEFWKCPNCNHVYWQGAHWSRIHATLEKAKKLRSILLL